MEKRSWERNVDSRIQIQLEEDGSGNTRQSWMETSGLWTMFHQEWQGISHLCDELSRPADTQARWQYILHSTYSSIHCWRRRVSCCSRSSV